MEIIINEIYEIIDTTDYVHHIEDEGDLLRFVHVPGHSIIEAISQAVYECGGICAYFLAGHIYNFSLLAEQVEETLCEADDRTVVLLNMENLCDDDCLHCESELEHLRTYAQEQRLPVLWVVAKTSSRA